tara:strand:- start:672 stop:836 length:165 start_codon:yes stop_codon:yes gene_type:complete
MTIDNPERFKVVSGSPYARKISAYLPYRQIGHAVIMGDQAEFENLPDYCPASGR